MGKVLNTLIVDDHVVMQDHKERGKIVKVLADKSFRSHVTHSPDEAIELARQIRFSLIMIEPKLNPINGLELYLALKQISPDTITIILADTDDVFIRQAKEAVQNNAYTFL